MLRRLDNPPRVDSCFVVDVFGADFQFTVDNFKYCRKQAIEGRCVAPNLRRDAAARCIGFVHFVEHVAVPDRQLRIVRFVVLIMLSICKHRWGAVVDVIGRVK